MPLLTPRRRFLITAPLALLLPAGLLTYLGLIAIRSMEIEFQLKADEKVEDIVRSVRNRTPQKIREMITIPFAEIIQRNINNLSRIIPPKPGDRLELDGMFPFATLLFAYCSDGKIYFFERDQTSLDYRHHWIYSPEPRTAFATRLIGKIDSEIESIQSFSYLNTIQPPEREWKFNHLTHPDPTEYMYGDVQRELAFFNIFYQKPSLNESTFYHQVKAFGFTISFDYVNTTFFRTMLNEMWESQSELQYPIAIEDHFTAQWIAQVNPLSPEPMAESRQYPPRYFNEDFFPWYKVHFSISTGMDVMQTAHSIKMVYYCLVAAANIIMILAVFGAVRNISQELALSDLRSNFVARVSHELRTPLGLIRLYAETLEMNRAKTEEKRKEYLQAITKESERLTHLINNILNFAQIESHKKHYKAIETHLDSIIEETVESMRYHLDRHDIGITVNIDPDMPLVRCDEEAIQLALFNLISNAMKYSGKGKEIAVNAYPRDGQAVIEIIDHGIGISPEHKRKIFDEFYRVDDPLVRETGGSGLGLAVVKHIIEGHRGTIDVESEPGWGSTFSIRLPIKA